MTSLDFLQARLTPVLMCLFVASTAVAQTTTTPVEAGRDSGLSDPIGDVTTLRPVDIEASPGDDILIDLEMDNTYPVISFEFDLIYDRDIIAFRDTDPRYMPFDRAAHFTLRSTIVTDEMVTLSARASTPSDAIPVGSGPIARIRATIPADAEPGVYEIEIDSPWILSDTRAEIDTEVETATLTIPFPDMDGDGFGSDEDCDDDDEDINPDATDVPDDGIDQDCDGEDATDDVGSEDDTADIPFDESEDTGSTPGEDSDEDDEDDGGDSSPTPDENADDADEAAPDAAKSGCSCSATPRGGVLAYWLAMTILIAIRRR
jgi:hypothetical protein